MAKRKQTEENRVWIELEVHSDAKVNEARAELATNILRKVGDTITKIWWNDRKDRYCISIDAAGSFLEMSDKGHWFNLDFMGK